jgi:uncharacterized protein YvpB
MIKQYKCKQGLKGCEVVATHILVQDDGKDNPGGDTCNHCADKTIKEYLAQLGEVWSVRSIRPPIKLIEE